MGNYGQESYTRRVCPTVLVPFCTGFRFICFGIFEKHIAASNDNYEDLDGSCRCSWLVLPDGAYSDAKVSVIKKTQNLLYRCLYPYMDTSVSRLYCIEE